MTTILAVDPGPTQSGFVRFNGERVLESGVKPNAEVLLMITNASGLPSWPDVVACEWISSYGMPVGREVFETALWTGRFLQAWREPEAVRLVYRKDVKLHLCGSSRAKDPNVRQAILDLFPRTGGGATPQVGTKHAPGPLYGVSTHAWPALGVAILVAHQIGTLTVTDAPMFRQREEVAFP